MKKKIRTTMNHEKNIKDRTFNTSNNARIPRLLAKMKMIFLQPSQNTAPATQNARAQIHWWQQVKIC